jgi:hypothetical protein
MSKECARPGCCELGLSRCSICLRESYCITDCQRGDWKSHKLICKTLKKLSHQLQHYQEVFRLIKEISKDKSKKEYLETRILGHLIAYAEYQFGDRIEGRSYRERENSDRMDNWEVEIEILIPLYGTLVVAYQNNKSLKLIARDNLIFLYYEKMLDLLRHWSEYVDFNSTSLRNSLTGDQINHII